MKSLNRILELVGVKKARKDFSITQAMRMRLAVEHRLNQIEAALPEEDRFFLSDYSEKYKEDTACALRRPIEESQK
jgi:hypothetical protein